mgnify:CR=1 FL=1|jgi:hypothetical protein
MPKMPDLNKLKEIMQNRIDRKARAKAAMEAEKVKAQDEKDMSNVQGAKDGGRMGYRMGGKCKLAKKGRGRAYGKNS